MAQTRAVLLRATEYATGQVKSVSCSCLAILYDCLGVCRNMSVKEREREGSSALSQHNACSAIHRHTGLACSVAWDRCATMVLSYLSSYVYGPAAPPPPRPAAPSRANSVRRRPAGSRGASAKSFAHQEPIHESDEDAATARGHDDPALAAIDRINSAKSLYEVVGISRTFSSNDELRRAYMARCRACHPESV